MSNSTGKKAGQETKASLAPKPPEGQTFLDPEFLNQQLDPIPRVFPFGSVTMFYGESFAGKTRELPPLLARLRDGRDFCGHRTNKQEVGIITTDHYWRLDQGDVFAQFGFGDIPHVSLKDHDVPVDWHVLKDGDSQARVNLLRLCCQKLALKPGHGTVCLDIGEVFITKDTNDYNAVMCGLNLLQEVTYQQFGLTVIATGHCSKPTGKERTEIHHFALGSVAHGGYSDQMMRLYVPDRPEGWEPHHGEKWESVRALQIRSRRIGVETHYFVFNQAGFLIPYEYIQSVAELLPPKQMSLAVLGLLTEGETAPRKVVIARSAEKLNLRSTQTDAALADLVQHQMLIRLAGKYTRPKSS
jgi:hypothetical protein